ncbi:hypothetical protein ACFFIF_09635 [Vagococcus entomophilus]|nr:hypothetical protein [Vagococcus entomophilus]
MFLTHTVTQQNNCCCTIKIVNREFSYAKKRTGMFLSIDEVETQIDDL